MESYPAGLWRSDWSGSTSISKALTGTDENVGQRRKDTRENSDQTPTVVMPLLCEEMSSHKAIACESDAW